LAALTRVASPAAPDADDTSYAAAANRAARAGCANPRCELVGQHDCRAARQQRYVAVCQLHEQGQSIRAIAQRLQFSRSTVYHYLRRDGDPTEWRTSQRASALAAYIPYLYARWQASCCNGVQLWREIREQGYAGSRKMVAVWVSQQRPAARAAGMPLPRRPGGRPWSVHRPGRAM
jgi:hypothetical protein